VKVTFFKIKNYFLQVLFETTLAPNQLPHYEVWGMKVG